MKLSGSLSFPHPVITPYTDDFSDQDIRFYCDIEEVIEPNSLIVNYELFISDPSVRGLVRDERCAPFLVVTSLETHLSNMWPLSLSKSRVVLPGVALHGRVRLLPIIAAVKDIKGFSSDFLHSEYKGRSIDYATGDLIGFGEELVVNVGREKLAAMESIFRISKSDRVTEQQIDVDLEKQWIEIITSKDLFGAVQKLRVNRAFHPVVMNSVYLPAVMQVISAISSGDQNYSGQRWYRILTAKCDQLGIELSAAEPLSTAQQLLHSPLGQLEYFVKRITDDD